MAYKQRQQLSSEPVAAHSPRLSVVSDNAAADRWREDGGLVQAALAGSPNQRHAAFAQLVERYQAYLRNMLLGLSGNADLADELAQDAFVQAWQKLDTLREPSRFQGWLKQLAYRHYLHHQRHQAVVARHRDSEMQQTREFAETPGPTEDWARLLKPCSALEQELLVLLFGFEFSYAEIAEARQMPLGTVKSHVHRAKAKIAEMLEE